MYAQENPVAESDWRIGLRPGDRVWVMHDDGSQKKHVVRSRPWNLHGEWVLLISDVTGCYALGRVGGMVGREECPTCRGLVQQPRAACGLCDGMGYLPG